MNNTIKGITISIVFFLAISGLIYGIFFFTSYTGFVVKEVVSIPFEDRFENGSVKISMNTMSWNFYVNDLLDAGNIMIDLGSLDIAESGELYIDILVDENVIESKKVIIDLEEEERLTEGDNVTEEVNETFVENITEPENNTQEENETEINLPFVEEESNVTEEVNETFVENITEPEVNITEPIIQTNISNASIVTEENKILQPRIVINQPVRWAKKVTLEDYASDVSITLPKDATNISVKKLDEGSEDVKGGGIIKIKDEGVITDLEEFNILTGQVIREINDKSNTNSIFKSVSEFFSAFFRKPTITGHVVEEIADSREVIIEGPVKEVEVEYEVPGPGVVELEKKDGKIVTVYSDIHYENILAYTEIPETEKEGIALYWQSNGTRILVENVDYVDKDENGLVDEIQWIVPSLSNQTYEVDLIILNVQSFPYIGGNWTVMFNTTGNANLTISAFNGTTFDDYIDDNETVHDLEFLDLRCGDNLVTSNLTENSTIFVEDYSCDLTGYETSKVLTTGDHYLKFEFGPITQYAKNLAAEFGGLAGGGNESGTINLVTGAVGFTGSNETTGDYTVLLHGLLSIGKNVTSGLYTLGLGYVYMLDLVQNVFVSLVTPEDLTTITDAVFTYRPSAAEVDSCSLYGDWIGGWHSNQTDYAIELGTTNQFTLSELEEGTFQWNVMCNNSQGDFFAESNYTFTLNRAPSMPDLNEPLNNSYWNTGIPEFNWSNSSDPSGDDISYYLEIDDSILFDSVDYANSSVKETINTTSDIPAGLSAGDYWWRVLAFDATGNSSWSEVNNLTIRFNDEPSVPELFLPYNDTDVASRKPMFSWSNSTDTDGDSITYNIQIDGSIDFSSPEVDGFDVSGIAETANTTNWTATSDLQNLDIEYFWRVRAYDGIVYGNWSEIRNFSIASTVIIELATDSVNFTVSNPGDADDTSDGSPGPIVIRNSGNVGADVNISLADGSTGLWASKPSPTNYFKYKIDNKTDEGGAFNWSDSITDWTDVDVANSSYKIRNLNYSDSTDEAELDILILVPNDEPVGEKSASIIITGAITSEIP